MGRRWSKGKYRWRTGLRSALPWALVGWIPKGRSDCGNHDWYKQDDAVDACYHCQATRPRPVSRSN
jgi:hypothetical protein